MRYGEATTDEMCIGFVAFTLKNQDLTKDPKKDAFVDYLEEFQKKMRERK